MKTLSFTAFPISLDPKRGPASNWLKDVTFHCPRLYELRLKLPFSMNKETCKSLLHPHTFTSLRSFRLSFGGYINLHRDLLENTRNLELSPQYPSDLSPPSFSLYEFGWSNFRDTSRTSNVDGFKYIVGWLFGESSSCLRILDLNEVRPRVEGEMLISMASNHGRNLSSLRTTLQKQDIVNLGLNLSEACPNLQELILHRVDFPSPELWRILPVGRLEHIAFSDCDYGASSRDKELISQAIDWTMSLPSIRLVTIQSNSYTEDSLNIVRWRKRCTKDVRLEIIHPIGDFVSDICLQCPSYFTLNNITL
ncbi:hypothetical protein FRC02_010259 [Tulasnella sp. 418]|nr:hypothetical protein FRC02_010259 [Tulasnella sp. 418]